MTDISKCSGEGCPLKETCWRYQAEAGDRQSWIEPPYKDGKCEIYWYMPGREDTKGEGRHLGAKTCYLGLAEGGREPG